MLCRTGVFLGLCFLSGLLGPGVLSLDLAGGPLGSSDFWWGRMLLLDIQGAVLASDEIEDFHRT